MRSAKRKAVSASPLVVAADPGDDPAKLLQVELAHGTGPRSASFCTACNATMATRRRRARLLPAQPSAS